jgi:hypothetical protein
VKELTEITPRWGHIPRMSIPDQGVDSDNDTKQDCAQYQSKSGNVAGSPLRGKWHEKQRSSNDRERGKFWIAHCRQRDDSTTILLGSKFIDILYTVAFDHQAEY